MCVCMLTQTNTACVHLKHPSPQGQSPGPPCVLQLTSFTARCGTGFLLLLLFYFLIIKLTIFLSFSLVTVRQDLEDEFLYDGDKSRLKFRNSESVLTEIFIFNLQFSSLTWVQTLTTTQTLQCGDESATRGGKFFFSDQQLVYHGMSCPTYVCTVH